MSEQVLCLLCRLEDCAITDPSLYCCSKRGFPFKLPPETYNHTKFIMGKLPYLSNNAVGSYAAVSCIIYIATLFSPFLRLHHKTGMDNLEKHFFSLIHYSCYFVVIRSLTILASFHTTRLKRVPYNFS